MKPKAASKNTDSRDRRRLKLLVSGAVQGVGFRPFVHRLASEFRLTGWVRNSTEGMEIEVEGNTESLAEFLKRLKSDNPPLSSITSCEYRFLDMHGYADFRIMDSINSGERNTIVLPDIATCADCLRDIFDKDNRRYNYPFTNCTNCGPRYSIIEALPYDRVNTSMRAFEMCDECRNEYEDFSDRRFHAQPNACPECGPHLELWDKSGKILELRSEALPKACELIRCGKILAVKGLGGFHLMVDARNDKSIERLRQLKGRDERPFAMMFPDIETIREYCMLGDLEESLLNSPEAPITLLRVNKASLKDIAASVAPDNPYFGTMIPYTPLHHLMMTQLEFPVVATSGNISNEPICTENGEALRKLSGIVDYFLVHNRPIVNHVDDSIIKVMAGREMIIRRARGYAPLPISTRAALPEILAVGGHQKNALAISKGNQIVVSQHIGDLETKETFDVFKKAINQLSALHDHKPHSAACDTHPYYKSTRFTEDLPQPKVKVQHHHAHILSCMAENELEPPVLGICWDGSGYGTDGTIWGGEFIRIEKNSFKRTAHFRMFPLPGGEAAIKEPRKTAIGLLFEIYGDNLFDNKSLSIRTQFTEDELGIIRNMLRKELNSPRTSSAGRLFDAVAALLGICKSNNYEGQAAMQLEFAAMKSDADTYYRYDVSKNGNTYIVDWERIIRGIIEEIGKVSVKDIAMKFHNTVVRAAVEIADLVNEEKIALSGGCFQNKILLEKMITELKKKGHKVYWHRRIPTNDGGIALGQIMAAARYTGS
ncbi:MAG: carbamoyltransferase HypF [candidate division Zixibacteria bacterium]|nr:carbamoyltransferase HypF [candidate division Zixibacteria bacterium]